MFPFFYCEGDKLVSWKLSFDLFSYISSLKKATLVGFHYVHNPMTRGGRVWFATEAKSFEIEVEEVGKRLERLHLGEM